MATYGEYLECLDTILLAPAALERERATAERDFQAAERIATASLEGAQALAAQVARSADAYLAQGRELLDAAQLGSLLPSAVRPVPIPVTAESTPTDISSAKAAVAESAEALRLAVLRDRQLAREAKRRTMEAAEARRRAEELVRREAERLAREREARRRRAARAATVAVAFLLTALVVLILR